MLQIEIFRRDRAPPRSKPPQRCLSPFVVVGGGGIKKCQTGAAAERLRAKRSVDLRRCR